MSIDLTAADRRTIHTEFSRKLFPDASALSVLYNTVSPAGFFAVIDLIFPCVKTYKGGVFLSWIDGNSIEEWLSRGFTILDAQYSLNKRTFRDLIQDDNSPNEVYRTLQQIVYKAWCFHLPVAAGRTIQVECLDEPDSYGPAVTFYAP